MIKDVELINWKIRIDYIAVVKLSWQMYFLQDSVVMIYLHVFCENLLIAIGYAAVNTEKWFPSTG